MSEDQNEKLLKDYPSYITIDQTKAILNQLENCICKIFVDDGSKATGFFCNIKHKNIDIPVLITNNHVLNEDNIKLNKIIKICFNNENELIYKDIKINQERLIYTSKKYDTTIIEIKKEKDEIFNYLELDKNIFQDNSNLLYYNDTIYILHYPGNKIASVSYGLLNKKEEINFEMLHYCSTEKGSSGSPILSLNDMKVIGIHKSAGNFNFNKGSFLKYPIEEFISQIKDNKLKNEIICIYNKQKDEINLLHDYSKNMEYMPFEEKKLYIEGKNNINEKNIEIYINSKKINFNYKYKSNEKGNIKVKFKFNKLLTNTSWMFYGCGSLESIDLSLFNTNNVNNMKNMFFRCSSLKSIDLSSFNTTNVNSMEEMFFGCSSLKSIDLYSFNTTNVNNMSGMFLRCSSLKSIDLSSFNTINVNNMKDMFSECSSLKSIDLSSLNTINVNNMSGMFFGCSSLKSIDLSSFNTINVNKMESMFIGCSSLKKENIKIKEYGKKLLDEIKYLK